MANANLNIVTITNTFDEWRTRTNALITDRNILRNHPYVKDNSNFVLANGALTIERTGGGVLLTVIGADGDAIIGGETTTTDLTVGIDASIGNSLVVGTTTANGNTIIYGNTSISKNTTISQNISVVGTANVTNNFKVGADKFKVTASSGDTLTEGDLTVNGGDIISTATANLLNTITTTLNLGGAATTVEIGAATGTTNINNNLDVDGDVNIDGGDLTASTSEFNLVNTTATTVNFAGAATTLEIGAATGTTNINNNLDVDGDVNIDGGDVTTSTATMNVFNATATTVNFAGAATTLEIGAASGTTNINNNLDVDGDVNIDGGDITTSTATMNVFNATATTVNFAGGATTLEIGAASGTTNINNNLDVDGDVNIDGGDITTSTTTMNVFNGTATTVNFAGAATSLEIGAATGTTNINNNLDVDGDINIDGGDITSSTATFNLINGTSTTVNFAGAATTLEIGAATGTTNINNNLDVDGDVNVDGGDITSSTATMNLINGTSTTVNFAGAATSLNMGAAAGLTTIAGDLQVTGNDIRSSTGATALTLSAADVTVGGDLTVTGNDIRSSTGAAALTLSAADVTVAGDLTVSGGDIISTATANLLNTSATLINFGGAAANVVLGSPTGTVNVRNQLYTTDNVYIPQGKNLFAYFIQTSATESFYIERGNGVFKNLSVTGTFTLSQPSITTSDKIILNEVPSPARDGYITVRRGSATSNASLQWLETAGVWRAGGSDAALATILTTANVSDSFVSSSLVNVASANSVRWALANGTFGGTLKSYKDFITEDTNVTGSKTIDMSVSNWYKLTLSGSSGNRQITFSNAPASGTGITITLVILQDGTGNKTPTWANTIYWAGGQVPPATTAASARDLWTFTTYDAGATFIGTLAVKDAK